MKSKILDVFGSELIFEVRDRVFRQFIKTIECQMQSEFDKKLFRIFKEMNDMQALEVSRCVLSVIDDMLHNFLWMIEQSDDFDLVAKTEEGLISLKEISDGLCGELYTEDGWISKFSEYPNLLD